MGVDERSRTLKGRILGACLIGAVFLAFAVVRWRCAPRFPLTPSAGSQRYQRLVEDHGEPYSQSMFKASDADEFHPAEAAQLRAASHTQLVRSEWRHGCGTLFRERMVTVTRQDGVVLAQKTVRIYW